MAREAELLGGFFDEIIELIGHGVPEVLRFPRRFGAERDCSAAEILRQTAQTGPESSRQVIFLKLRMNTVTKGGFQN